jgi:hypothetical protein
MRRLRPGYEAEDDDVTVGTQDAVHFTQNLVRPVAVIERMRQQDRVDRVAFDGQPVELTNRGRTAERILGNQCTALGACEAHECTPLAPHAELQAFFAKDAVESLLHDTGLLLQEHFAQRRLQPFPRVV